MVGDVNGFNRSDRVDSADHHLGVVFLVRDTDCTTDAASAGGTIREVQSLSTAWVCVDHTGCGAVDKGECHRNDGQCGTPDDHYQR